MDYPVQIVTGPPGGGKSYWVVKRLVEEVLPIFKDVKVLTNIPIFWPDDPDRIVIQEFPRGWVPGGDLSGLPYEDERGALTDNERRMESVRNTVVIIDEAQEVLDKEHEQIWRELLGKARKRNTRYVFMSQSKDNLFKWLDDLAQVWLESINGGSLRDSVFGFRVHDLQNVWAKATGKWIEFFCKTEYGRRNRRWYALNKVPYKEFFDPKVGDHYDTKNGADCDESGGAVVTREYQQLSWPKLIYVVALRNWQVIPLTCVKFGLPFAAIGGSVLVWVWASHWRPTRPVVEPPVLTVSDRAVKAQQERVPVAAVGGVSSPAGPVVPTEKTGARSRVLRWCVLVALLLNCGCRVGAEKNPTTEVPHHVGRVPATPDPRVAVFGEGHSLDQVLGEVGIESHTDAVVAGPLVGREVLDLARSHGHSLNGKTLVPARKRPVSVPSELGQGVKGTVNVGGYPVKVVDDAEIDYWRDLSDVQHEAYCTELLIVSVTSSRSTQLSLIASGGGGLSVTYPSSSASPWWSGTNVQGVVSLAANGSVVNGRVVAHPLLTSSPSGSSTVHVGQKIPVMLAQSTVTNQTTTTLGTSLTYVTTGTNVTVRPTRVSASQVRLVGSVTLSAQVGEVDNVPVTEDRSLSLDHLVKLDQWAVVGRLDSVTSQSSGGVWWLSLGGAWSHSDDAFVVLAKCVQVHDGGPMHREPVSLGVKEVKEIAKGKDVSIKPGSPVWKKDVDALKEGVFTQSPQSQVSAPGTLGVSGPAVPGAVPGVTGQAGPFVGPLPGAVVPSQQQMLPQ